MSPCPTWSCSSASRCWSRWRAAFSSLLLLVPLAGCGDLPRPFQGNPGRTALRLAQPPPSRLSVPVPPASLLPDEAAAAWAGDVADALGQAEVPAFAGPVKPNDWQLTLSATLHGDQVVPRYAVRNPRGQEQGATEGPPVAVAAWAAARPATLKQAALQAAPSIASLLISIEAARQQSDPNSLLNRPTRVYVAGVSGAPGDGDESLARQIRAHLPRNGEVVQDTPAGADYKVEGRVRTAPGARGQTRVEIQWIVTDASGRESGRIVQINEVPPGTLDQFWGDVAVVVAEEASGGVRNVIANQSIVNRAKTLPAAPPPPPPS